VDFLFGFDATTGLVGDHQYALVADAYVHDSANRAFLEQHNPQALRSIGERLLEAMQRGLWHDPREPRERIEQALLALDHRLETQGEGPTT
jgi:cobaltochelatase CobN